MISLVSYQSSADRRFDANRQLVGQGVGSAVVALFGGLTNSGILARAAVNQRAGGRTMWSGVINALGVFLLIVALSRPLALLPKAAIAGLIMVIASSLFDRWSFEQLREAIRRDAHDRGDNVLATVQMCFVVLIGVTVSLVAAVGAGILLSVIVFVAQMTRSPIRRVRTGKTVRSARSRDPDTTRLLSESGHRIAVIEIEGTIFFGTAEALAAQAELLADEGTDFVLFDLKRLHAVDATGFKVLGQTFARLRKRGTTLGFSYVIPDVLRDEVAEDLMVQGVPEARMWPSTDRALEYFEEGLLMKLGADEYDEEGWSLELFGAEWGLAPEQCAKLAAYLRQREFDGGEFLFEEGDTDRSMFLLRKGFADLSIQVPESERRLRVSTASRGTVLGEISMLDGFPRSASAMAASPILAYELTYDDFQRLLDEEPEIGVHFLAGVSETLAKRLRRADDLIIELET
jgi:SulP family sulfate permease